MRSRDGEIEKEIQKEPKREFHSFEIDSIDLATFSVSTFFPIIRIIIASAEIAFKIHYEHFNTRHFPTA